eukprot:jgi/Chlat1/3072/Chrsp21S03387
MLLACASAGCMRLSHAPTHGQSAGQVRLSSRLAETGGGGGGGGRGGMEGASRSHADDRHLTRRPVIAISVHRADLRYFEKRGGESRQTATLEEMGMEEYQEEERASSSGRGGSDDDGEVDVAMRISKAVGGLYVKGRARTRIHRNCDRCLAHFATAVDAPFEVFLTAEELDDPAAVHFPVSAEVADLTAVVRDAIILSQPLQAVCSAKCKSAAVSSQWQGLSGAEAKEAGDTSGGVDSRWAPLLRLDKNALKQQSTKQ